MSGGGDVAALALAQAVNANAAKAIRVFMLVSLCEIVRVAGLFLSGVTRRLMARSAPHLAVAPGAAQ